jgi:formylmethanofuran dehydrogenase subunit C
MTGGEIVVNGNVDVHALTHAEGGRLVVKGNANSKVGGQMIDGEIIIFGTIDTMMPGFKPVDTVELEVEGVKAKFSHFIGDMGERHKKKKGQMVYANLYVKA